MSDTRASSGGDARIDVDALLASVDLVEVVGSYVELKKAGAELLGLCPFHGEKTPSFRVVPHKGFFHCFGCGAHGDALDLVQQLEGIGFREAAERLGASQPATKRKAPPPPPDRITSKPPASAAAPDMHSRQFGDPVRTWAYRDAAGDVLGYVARYEYEQDGKRKKLTPQWTWGQRGTERPGWAMAHWSRPRPLYGLDRLAARLEAPVLICEGEKATDAGAALLPAYVAVSWPGGVNAIKHADWQPLAGRSVVIWPDADDPGRAGAAEIARTLHGLGCKVRMIRVDDKADGWDLADALADGWSNARTLQYAKAHVHDWRPDDPPPPDQRPAAEPPPVPEPPLEAYEQDRADSQSTAVAPPQPVQRELVFPHARVVGKRLVPKSTLENLQALCQFLGTTVRYNVITKEEEILIPGEAFSRDNRANASLAWITSRCAEFDMPTGSVGDYLTYLADRHLYNPVAEWITSKPWDGQSRLQDLYDTITATGDSQALKETYIRRWMISAVAAAFEPDGVSAHGVLVFQGDQDLGKTRWFKALVPKELGVVSDGRTLKPDDRDSVKQIVSNWLVELGELDATFRKSDIAQLKSFITRDRDVLRRAYAKRDSEFARRTVFFGSVNPKEFLHDHTGNRRYWTIECTAIDHGHSIDMQQVWAEVLTLYRAGEPWFLQADEFDGMTESNAAFEVVDPIDELITTGLRWGDATSDWRWRSATEVLRELGRDTPTQAEATRAAHVIRKLNGKRSRKANGARTLYVPLRWSKV